MQEDLAGTTVEKTDDQEFTFQVAELDVYGVEGITLFNNAGATSDEQINALVNEAIKRQITVKLSTMQQPPAGDRSPRVAAK